MWNERTYSLEQQSTVDREQALGLHLRLNPSSSTCPVTLAIPSLSFHFLSYNNIYLANTVNSN